MAGRDLAPNHRNIKLDFFRGLALLVIFINHVPGNELLLYTPSRYGLSDAAEIFVFLSGYAAAIAYGRTFQTVGFALGSVRVFHRCFQIYAAHLGLFALLAMVCVVGNEFLETRDYVTHLNIRYFFDHTEEALLGLIALRYVPNYFDILPMYLVVMLWIPAVVAFSRLHTACALGFSACVYLAMWRYGLEFSADPNTPRPWFFNPFGWQLIFFIGFAFGSGWLKVPSSQAWLVVASLALLVAALPFSPEPALRPTVGLQSVHGLLLPLLEKTRFGPLRLLHFLAVAYLVVVFLRKREHWLHSRWAKPVVQIGRQSLPIFVVSMALSYIGGMAFDLFGHDVASIVAINAGGCVLMLVLAQGMTWLKSSPWKISPAAGISDSADGLVSPWPHWDRVATGATTLVLLSVVSAVPILISNRAAEVGSAPDALMQASWAIDSSESLPELLYPPASVAPAPD